MKTFVKNVRMQILISEELKKRLKEVSENTGMSMNDLINKGTSAYLKRYEGKKVNTKALQDIYHSGNTHAKHNK